MRHSFVKLRKIEALFAGAGTVGERLAAEVALERARTRLVELERLDPFRMSERLPAPPMAMNAQTLPF